MKSGVKNTQAAAYNGPRTVSRSFLVVLFICVVSTLLMYHTLMYSVTNLVLKCVENKFILHASPLLNHFKMINGYYNRVGLISHFR